MLKCAVYFLLTEYEYDTFYDILFVIERIDDKLLIVVLYGHHTLDTLYN